MPEDLQSRPAQDQERIHVDRPYDLWDWAIYFSVSRERIRDAVSAVGPRVEDVKRFLGK